MPKFLLIGRVSSMGQDFISLPPTDVEFTDGELRGVYRMRINNSIVNVECEYNPHRDGFHYLILNNAGTMVRAALNLLSFAVGKSLSHKFEFVIMENGTPAPISVVNGGLADGVTAVNPENSEEFNKLLHTIIRENGHAIDVIDDLRAGIGKTIFSIVGLARAIEGIKQDISEGNRNDKQAWQTMRDTLHVSEAYLRYITDASTDPRHGRKQKIHGHDGIEIARRCWAIANRYLEYIKRGRKELPINDFPIL